MEKYNGWTNYETWLVNVHWGDDEHLTKELCQTVDSVGDYSRAIKDYIEEYLSAINTIENCFLQDMLNSAMSDVDWYDLAESYYKSWLEGQVSLDRLALCTPCYFQGSAEINFAVPAHKGMTYDALKSEIEDSIQAVDAGQWELELPCGITFNKVDLSMLIDNFLGNKTETLLEPIPECLYLEDTEEIEVYYYFALTLA